MQYYLTYKYLGARTQRIGSGFMTIQVNTNITTVTHVRSLITSVWPTAEQSVGQPLTTFVPICFGPLPGERSCGDDLPDDTATFYFVSYDFYTPNNDHGVGWKIVEIDEETPADRFMHALAAAAEELVKEEWDEKELGVIPLFFQALPDEDGSFEAGSMDGALEHFLSDIYTGVGQH